LISPSGLGSSSLTAYQLPVDLVTVPFCMAPKVRNADPITVQSLFSALLLFSFLSA
jgi:hypothetical protein